MHMEGSRITLPVSVVSDGSGRATENGITRTETFSREYSGALPNMALLELGAIYKNTDYMCIRSIDIANKAISLLCKYMVQNKIDSLSAIHSMDLVKIREFLKQETSPLTMWRNYMSSLRANSTGTALGHLIWPKATTSSRERKTQGHSMYAYKAMGEALRKEINRIREKKGRLAAAIEKGKVLTMADIGNEDSVALVTRDDFICTILHYLPGWPVVNRLNLKNTWAVYGGPQGILLGSFASMDGAETLAAEHGAEAIVKPRRVDNLNPGEYMLYCLRYPKKFRYYLSCHLKSLFNDQMDIIDTYFLTSYDWQCVYLYWVWLTGWNVETMASVAAHDLGFGIDIKKHSTLELVTDEHVEIIGKAPTCESSIEMRGRRKNTDELGGASAVITGLKTRSQPKNKPKRCTHISDKNDQYSLYCVLKDFYELTEPLRSFLVGDEKNCILVGVPQASINVNLSMFGAPLHCIYPAYNKNGLGRFFEKHIIYEDEQEFTGSATDESHHTAADGTTTPNNFTRLLSTTAMKMRTTWESWLKVCGVPPTLRQIKMNHESEKTTHTSYGAERVSAGMRFRGLRHMLNKIENKIFQGQLEPYGHRDSPRNKDNVVQIYSHRKIDVFICWNPKDPTWPGHEEYVEKGGCTEFDECLFCKQCHITPDTLPVLLRWQRDIKQMGKLVGPIGIGYKVSLLRQAIDEVFELCRTGGAEWQIALERAYEIEMDPEFTAPPFTYRYAAQWEAQ